MTLSALGLDPERLIELFGLVGIWAIVFAESGLLVGFFLPGDALLFTAGFFASSPESIAEELHLSLVPLVIGIVVAAIAGDQVGYQFGKRMGPAIFKRPDSRFFKQQNVDKAREYFDRYGARTIVVARFVPIVRTFAPVVAGVSGMEYRTFVRWNVLGGLFWGVGVTMLGFFLGQIDVIAENIELTILVVVGLSCSPIAIELWRARKHRAVVGDTPIEDAIKSTLDVEE